MLTAPDYLPLTHVRWPSRDAAEILAGFLLHGGSPRPPRGIDPEFVSWWVRENLKPDASPELVRRLRDLLFFYDRRDLLDPVSRLLTRAESDDAAFRRSCYVLQIIGELGTAEQVNFASQYFAQYLLPLPFALDFFALLTATAEALALAIDVTALGARLQAGLNAASRDSIAWRKYSDYNRNTLPASVRVIEAKRRLLATDPVQRLQHVLMIYMGESEFSSPSTEIWAGRLLRALAFQGGYSPVVTALHQLIDVSLRANFPQARRNKLLFRAGHALLYLRADLALPHETAFDALPKPPEPTLFLCDDIER